MACSIDTKTNATMCSCNIRPCWRITQIQSYYTKCRKIRASNYIPNSDHGLKFKNMLFYEMSDEWYSADVNRQHRILSLNSPCSSIAVKFLSCKCKYSSVVACNHDTNAVALTWPPCFYICLASNVHMQIWDFFSKFQYVRNIQYCSSIVLRSKVHCVKLETLRLLTNLVDGKLKL